MLILAIGIIWLPDLATWLPSLMLGE
jgi:hypothetical protein